jgi:hypothetical protein
MAYLTGTDGLAKVNAATIINVKSWSLDIGRNFEDTTALGDSWDESCPTTGRCSGSIEVDYDPSDTNGQLAIQTVILSGASITLKLLTDPTHMWSGSAKFTGSIKVAAKAMQTATLSFTGTGEWAYGAAA